MKYQRKMLNDEDMDRMRINLAVISRKMSAEPSCDFCGGSNPMFCYAAVRMSTGEWRDNWRWCACFSCAGDIEVDNWPRLEHKLVVWLQKAFPTASYGVLKMVVRESMSEFMLYAAKTENGISH